MATEAARVQWEQRREQCRARCRVHRERRAAAEGVPRGESDPLPPAPVQFGQFGPGVAQLQAFLIEHGLMSPDDIRWRAGVFGPRTANAIYRFQVAAGLADTEPGVLD